MDELQPIVDYKTYNNRMSLAIIDKLFFADKISPDLIIDFGCADGTLLRQLKLLKPDTEMIGYDTDPEMVAKYYIEEIPIFSNWNSILSEKNFGDVKHPAIVLSSVIHEALHYGSKADIDDFWRKVFESGFEFIVIRDMVPSRSIDRPTNINDLKKAYHKFLHTKALTDFESVWGSIEGNRQLIHFLLKYRYLQPNWDREVRENYLPITKEDLLAKIPNEYDVIFSEHYVLPYILQTVRDETGIEVKDPHT